MVAIGSAALTVSAALLSTAIAISTTPGSGFVSSDSSLTFALNIPQADDSNDLYFTMAGSSSSSWIAVGMGSNNMANSLIFMAYSDSTGQNITLSPRLVYGNVEPSLTDLSVTVLPGSGIANNIMTVNAKCTNCRTWKGGSIHPNNTAADFIFAVGPDGSIKSNSGSANIKRHSEYGTFVMDLTKAFGVAGVPVAMTADTSGVSQMSLKNDHDFGPPLHAALMIVVFVGAMPFGVVVLRLLNSPKWHWVNQSLSAAGALVGAGLGTYIGTLYNRSKNFNSAHQVIGLVIIVALVGQWILGFLHHRLYKRTTTPTKFSPFHIWLGRILIPLGIINGFFGFPLALNQKYNWALVALFLFLIIVICALTFWRWKRNGSMKMGSLPTGGGYQAEPWRAAAPSQSDINLAQYNTGYPPTHAPQTGYLQPPVEGWQFV